jgi:hypothetical protein
MNFKFILSVFCLMYNICIISGTEDYILIELDSFGDDVQSREGIKKLSNQFMIKECKNYQ